MNITLCIRFKLVRIILNQGRFLKLCIGRIRERVLEYNLVSLVELPMQERYDDMPLEQIVQYGRKDLFWRVSTK